MRWACILLPQLALDGVLRGRDDPRAPFALLEGPEQRRVLRALNPAARALGLRPGMALSAARALAGDFACVLHDAQVTQRSQDFLAAWAYRFSGQVSRDFPCALLMEVHSSLGLFGPWPRLQAQLREELDALGFQRRIVLAPNPLAARILANCHDGLAVDDAGLAEALGALPVERLGLPSEQARALRRMGLRQLAQVRALPRAALARRFPAQFLAHLDRLYGLGTQALEFYQPEPRFDARLELNFDVQSHQALLFPLRRLTADLAAFLAGRDCGVQRFALHLEHRHADHSRIDVGLLSAEREAAALFELARGRLEQLQVPEPVLALRLIAEDLPAFVPERQGLFDERPTQGRSWEQLRERLRARLGDAAVQPLAAHADHRPECAWRLQSGGDQAPPSAPRPGWLLAEPQAGLLVERVLTGPERIESGWWEHDVRRDYYRVLTRDGRQAWAFRQPGSDAWFLHGWFA